MLDKIIQDKIRKKADQRQLLVLRVIANSTDEIVYVSKMKDPLYGVISNSNSTAEQTMGGVLSSVLTMRGKEGPLLLAMGKDEYGVRWKLNESVISKNELKELVDELLSSWKE